MEFVIVCSAALVVSALTLFSGFGLGTLLMPVFALFFPIDVAVAATAVVHGSNSVVKVLLLGRAAEWGIVVRFALPALVLAFVGAALLVYVSDLPALLIWTTPRGKLAEVTPIKLTMAVLLIVFAMFELLPRLRELRFEHKYLPLGGVLSGFFGGLSGHQGALRAAFLTKTGLSTEAFVATNAVSGFLVDLSRLIVYGLAFWTGSMSLVGHGHGWQLVLAGCAAAFTGVLVGSRLVKKVTMSTIQTLTGILLLVLAGLLGAGLI